MRGWQSISQTECLIKPTGALTCGLDAANMTVKGGGTHPSPPCLYFCSIDTVLCGYTKFRILPLNQLEVLPNRLLYALAETS